MARTIGSPGWLLAAWVLTGVLTVGAAAIYGELSSSMPEAGGMYRYLSECYSPLVGFLYGWTFLPSSRPAVLPTWLWLFRVFSATFYRKLRSGDT